MKRALERDDGSYQPGPTLQVGSVHFNAMYDGATIDANEEAWRSEYSKNPPDKVLTFSRVCGSNGVCSSEMVENREVYDLFPSEPVFVCTGASTKSRQQRHACFVTSSVNHMCISDEDVIKVAKAVPGSALCAMVNRMCDGGHSVLDSCSSIVSRMADEHKREVLQRKYQLRFVGFSIGCMKNDEYKMGKKSHVACNAGGLMSIKADACIESGQYVVVDFPIANLHRADRKRQNKCFPASWLQQLLAQNKDQCNGLEEKATMIVRALDPASDFSSMSQSCFHHGSGHCGGKFPPWIVGQCIRGCSQPGKTIDLRYSAEIRFPRYITLLSPPPMYMNRPSQYVHDGASCTPGTTLHDLYVATANKLLGKGDTGIGDMHEVGSGIMPSIDCQDIVRHMRDRCSKNGFVENDEESKNDEENEKLCIGETPVDPTDILMGLVNDIFEIAESNEVRTVDKITKRLKMALKRASGTPACRAIDT